MKRNAGELFVYCVTVTTFVYMLACFAGCERSSRRHPHGEQATTSKAFAPDPLRVALAPIERGSDLDLQIAAAQERVRASTHRAEALEQLGWLFIARARVSFDPGYYNLAVQCALAMEPEEPANPAALLLRGHALQNLHKFKEAEPLARQLVAARGGPADFGLLGDVLMEQGRLPEAVEAYQRMADLKPDMHALVRAAQMRWLTGDPEGAVEAARDAVAASSPRAPEPAAWAECRLAFYSFQTGDMTAAARACDEAIELQPDYPPALLLRGRILLAAGAANEAVPLLRRAAGLNPVTDYLWTLQEALETAGMADEAVRTQKLLMSRGLASDPRTYSLYLATRRIQPGNAERVARLELDTRQDAYTWDAFAWAEASAGHLTQASEHIQRALASGVKEPRLLLHAALIAKANGEASQADNYLAVVRERRRALLPSEQTLLEEVTVSHGLASKPTGVIALSTSSTLQQPNSKPKMER